jgi:hypothetical protein
MIGSVNEYAKILGKSVTEMTEDKYQPPPAEASESEVSKYQPPPQRPVSQM